MPRRCDTGYGTYLGPELGSANACSVTGDFSLIVWFVFLVKSTGYRDQSRTIVLRSQFHGFSRWPVEKLRQLRSRRGYWLPREDCLELKNLRCRLLLWDRLDLHTTAAQYTRQQKPPALCATIPNRYVGTAPPAPLRPGEARFMIYRAFTTTSIYRYFCL